MLTHWTPTVDLSITKTDGVAAVQPNQVLTYTIVVTNTGPSVVTGATITDTFPAFLLNPTWTCSASSGSSCGSGSGSGNLNTTANLLAGGTVTYTVNATVCCIGEWFDHEHGDGGGAGRRDRNQSGEQQRDGH